MNTAAADHTPFRRIMVVGDITWTHQTTITNAFKRVMDVYRDPYLLIADDNLGAAALAIGRARELGWRTQLCPYDHRLCDPKHCPPPDGHRRPDGNGNFCPTARIRNTNLMLTTTQPHILLVFANNANSKLGAATARTMGIAVWQYQPPRPRPPRKRP